MRLKGQAGIEEVWARGWLLPAAPSPRLVQECVKIKEKETHDQGARDDAEIVPEVFGKTWAGQITSSKHGSGEEELDLGNQFAFLGPHPCS